MHHRTAWRVHLPTVITEKQLAVKLLKYSFTLAGLPGLPRAAVTLRFKPLRLQGTGGPANPEHSLFPMTLHQGQMVRLSGSPEHTYQVISIDADASTCWVRRWPLSRHGSPPFALALDQLQQLEPASV